MKEDAATSVHVTKYFKRAAVEIQDLPKINIVLVSQNHYDHLDIANVRLVAEKRKDSFSTGLALVYTTGR